MNTIFCSLLFHSICIVKEEALMVLIVIMMMVFVVCEFFSREERAE